MPDFHGGTLRQFQQASAHSHHKPVFNHRPAFLRQVQEVIRISKKSKTSSTPAENRPDLPPVKPARLAILGTLFLLVVIVTVVYQNTFFLPIYLGLLTAAKALLKKITPKFFMLFLKNSIIIKIRQFITRGSAHLFLLSHRPSRLKLRSLKEHIARVLIKIPRWYMQRKLWIRTVIALGLLLLTASSSYVFIALLIIPQPLLNWVKQKFLTTLNKLGITQLLNTIWRFVVPAGLQRRWYIYQKWTLGRRQITTARKMHRHIADKI